MPQKDDNFGKRAAAGAYKRGCKSTTVKDFRNWRKGKCFGDDAGHRTGLSWFDTHMSRTKKGKKNLDERSRVFREGSQWIPWG